MSTNVIGECYKTSNNKYFNCPPRMADGRHFTDYRPNCYVNNLLRANNKLYNSFEYRTFLTNNANNLMNLNRAYACQKNCCGPCKKPYEQGTMLPEQSEVTCNSNVCDVSVTNINGLGQGRNYGNGGNKNDKGCKHCEGWPNSLPVDQPYNCCSDSKELFNYYDDVDTKAQGDLNRYTIPSGGVVMSGGDPKAYNY